MRRHATLHPARGFTVVELLIVMAIIVVLTSLVVVAVRQAQTAARETRTRTVMTSVSQGLARFEADHGYLPPVLDEDRALLAPPDPGSAQYVDEVQDWFSVTSLADFLIGYGEGIEDGHGYPPSEIPPTGIRSPGFDGLWGATGAAGLLTDRNPPTQGKVYGPYIEIDDDRLLASIDGTINPVTGTFNTFFAGEANYDPDAPKVICDYWGSPIRYYRRAYPDGRPGERFAPVDRDDDGAVDPLPALGDVFVLRPYEIRVGADVSNRFPDDNPDVPNGDPSSSRALEGAAFALFSPGQDLSLTPRIRVDEDEFNADNIVELGQ